MKVNDIAILPNSRGEDFTVRILSIFSYDGVKYVEIEPVDFNGFIREVETSRLIPRKEI